MSTYFSNNFQRQSPIGWLTAVTVTACAQGAAGTGSIAAGGAAACYFLPQYSVPGPEREARGNILPRSATSSGTWDWKSWCLLTRGLSFPEAPWLGPGHRGTARVSPCPGWSPVPAERGGWLTPRPEVASCWQGLCWIMVFNPPSSFPARRAAIPDLRGALSRSAHNFQNPPWAAAEWGLELSVLCFPFLSGQNTPIPSGVLQDPRVCWPV